MLSTRESELERPGDSLATGKSAVQIERELVRLSHFMDTLFRVPILGWRFGLNTIIDLVPAIGDVATSIISLYLLVSAVRYRVPKITLVRMAINTAIYYVAGLVPVAGVVFGAWWKPNQRNLKLLRRRATVSANDARKARKSDLLFVWGIVAILLLLLIGSAALAYLVLRALDESLSVTGPY